MKMFHTEYQQGSAVYSGQIFAKDFDHAKEIAMTRNMGEAVKGQITGRIKTDILPSDLYKQRKLEECLHYLTFLLYIALKSGVITEPMHAILADQGFMHEVIHELHHPSHYTFRESIYRRMVALESIIPGLKGD